MLTLAKFSIGVGDRFAHQARAQLQACLRAQECGVLVVPVWNKSNREHTTIGSEPLSVRAAADQAVRDLGWTQPYHVDADHIRLETVDRFIPHSDFFTIDVADSIGKPASAESIDSFIASHPELEGEIKIARLDASFRLDRSEIRRIAAKFLFSIQEAGKINRHIESLKQPGKFITEVSLDETDSPQTPPELLIILAGLASEGIPVQSIAPKFTGRFNKGVDFVGDLRQFAKEFEEDLAVISHAIQQYGLSSSLKLSVHSGSDKFSLYKPIRQALAKFGAGVHLKTAGTTWLEELIGLAEAGGSGLDLAKEIYGESLAHLDELCAPYAAVIDIHPARLPSSEVVRGWSSEQFVRALRHDPTCSEFNPDLRQLLHVGYKIAAKMGSRYLQLLKESEPTIARNVVENLYDRHIKPLFIDQCG